jgi:hypothetical protein
MNILLLTSCNRIKQVLLSLSLNTQIIGEKFSVIIADSSTPGVDPNHMCQIHSGEDPYNWVKPENFCSDVDLLHSAHQYFPQIEQFKVIHTSPRLVKQRGEATLIALGLMQASIMGERHYQDKQNFCLKLTGTSILNWDVVGSLSYLLGSSDVATWHRTNIGGQERSTRIFASRPEVLSGIIAKTGWKEWCDDNPQGVLEQRFARIINQELDGRINYTERDDADPLYEGGCSLPQHTGREMINQYIQSKGIDTTKTPWLQEFVNGGIW